MESMVNLTTLIKKNWQLTPRITPQVNSCLEEYPAYMRQILYNRGCFDIEQARCFLEGQVPESTDPFGILGMDLAVDRIFEAIQAGELIAVYGDYDVDGVTATLLLIEVLNKMGASVINYIPNRYDEGYGLNNEAILSLSQQGVRLVITVDCGDRSFAEAQYASTLGIALIISDHHQPTMELPVCIAMINPKQVGDRYPEKDLTGVGLAYKIAQALLLRKPMDGTRAEDWLDLVALGTICDLAPLRGENRALIQKGLKFIQKHKRQGIFSLCQTAGMRDRRVTAGDIGYILGPRLNAAGRMDSAKAAFDLLETTDPRKAGELAQILETNNFDRQKKTREVQANSEKSLSETPQAQLIFVASPEFMEGILGLAAARLVEVYFRPAIVAHQGEEMTRASCRSIPDFNITEALDQCADLLIRYGGHRAAAGFTVLNKNLPELMIRLRAIALEYLQGKDLQPILEYENELHLDQLHGENLRQILRDLAQLQPTGIGNPEPVFFSSNLEVTRVQVFGQEKNHLRLTLKDSKGVSYYGVAFRQGSWAEKKPDHIDLVYSLEINEFQGRQDIQLNIKDIRSVAQ